MQGSKACPAICAIKGKTTVALIVIVKILSSINFVIFYFCYTINIVIFYFCYTIINNLIKKTMAALT